MSKKKIILVSAAVLLTAGAVAAISAPGPRGGRDPGGEFGMGDNAGGMMGRPGFMQRMRGSITKDEFDARARERFARLDKNGDGILDAAEIEAAFAQRPGQGPGAGMGEQMFQRMLARFGATKEGKITKDQFQAVIKKRFAEMDLNNDGKISDEDLPPMMRGRNALARLGQGTGGQMGRGPGGGTGGQGGQGGQGGMMDLLRGAEVKDGAVTLDAVVAASMKRFEQLDRNKDGVIDKADFDLMRKEAVDYRVKRFVHSFAADKEGKVTRDQFMAKANERFAQLDVNGDGKITRDEMPGRGRMMGLDRGGQGGDQGGGRGPRGWFGRGAPQGGPADQPKKN